jgi:hypothetical protein
MATRIKKNTKKKVTSTSESNSLKTPNEIITLAQQGTAIRTAYQLAEDYLNDRFELLRRIVNFDILLNKQHCETSQVTTELQNKYKKALKESFARLSQRTQDQLRDNYDELIIGKIIAAILNFQYVILMEKEAKEFFKRVKEIRHEINQRLFKAVKYTDSLLKVAFLSKAERIILIDIKDRHKKLMLKEPEQYLPVADSKKDFLSEYNDLFSKEVLKEMWKSQEEALRSNIDPVKTIRIYEGFTVVAGGVRNPEYSTRKWRTEYLFELLKLGLQPQHAKPKFFLQALQIVIYKLLTHKEPKKKKHYFQWAKTLTADIINDAYARLRLKKITAKDVENSNLSI